MGLEFAFSSRVTIHFSVCVCVRVCVCVCVCCPAWSQPPLERLNNFSSRRKGAFHKITMVLRLLSEFDRRWITASASSGMCVHACVRVRCLHVWRSCDLSLFCVPSGRMNTVQSKNLTCSEISLFSFFFLCLVPFSFLPSFSSDRQCRLDVLVL